MTGLIYYLIANPDKMKTLTKEIRETFPSSDAISFQELAKLKYLDACKLIHLSAAQRGSG